MARHKRTDPYYMASYKNKTGPAVQSMKAAAVGYFNSYPSENKCYVSEGELVGNNIFIATMGQTQVEITKDMVGL